MHKKEVILEVKNLKKHFPVASSIPFKKSRQKVHAVDGISFEVFKGETLGIVGESGCGKSTVARLINQLIPQTEGTVEFHGQKLEELTKNEVRSLRRNIQMVFQNPYSSLDPRKNIQYLLTEPMTIHKQGSKKENIKQIEQLLTTVGLKPEHMKRLPHEFSGGQRQRINIARALTLKPEIVICDEPVSALDVSVQAQVINLLKQLQKDFKLTYLFISHDLNVVNYICDRIIVMYLGKIVEIGTAEEIYSSPKHPYTQALLTAIPKENPFVEKETIILSGDVPSPINPPSGCSFHKRCKFATEKCSSEIPKNTELSDTHKVSCHLY